MITAIDAARAALSPIINRPAAIRRNLTALGKTTQ